jgi:hypothetical protein
MHSAGTDKESDSNSTTGQLTIVVTLGALASISEMLDLTRSRLEGRAGTVKIDVVEVISAVDPEADKAMYAASF